MEGGGGVTEEVAVFWPEMEEGGCHGGGVCVLRKP